MGAAIFILKSHGLVQVKPSGYSRTKSNEGNIMLEGTPGPSPEGDKEAVDGATPEVESEVAPIELTRAEYDVLLSSPSDSAEIKALAAEKGIEYGEPGSRVKIRVTDPENDPDGNWPKELWMATDKEHFGDKLSNRHGQHPEIEE